MALDARETLSAHQSAARRFDALLVVAANVELGSRFYRRRIGPFKVTYQTADIRQSKLRHPREHVGPVMPALIENCFQPISTQLGANAAQARRNAAFVAHLGHVALKKWIARSQDAAHLVPL